MTDGQKVTRSQTSDTHTVRYTRADSLENGIMIRISAYTMTLSLCLLLYTVPVRASEVMTISDAVRTALSRNIDLRTAEQTILRAQHIHSSAGANWFPSVDMSSSYTQGSTYIDLGISGEASQPPVPHFALYDATGNPFGMYVSLDEIKSQALAGVGGKTDIANAWRTEFTMRQVVYSPDLIAGVRQARAGIALSREALRIEQNDIALQTIEAYYNVLKAREGKRVAERALNRAREQHRVTESLHAEGVVSQADVLRSQVQIVEAERTLISISNSVELAGQAFNVILQRPLNATVELDTAVTVNTVLPLPADSCIAIALRERPELAALGQQGTLNDAEIQSARAAYLPTVGVEAAYGWEHTNPLLDRDKEHWRVSAGLSMNLFRGGSDFHSVQAARVKRRQTELGSESARNGISLQVSQAYLNVRESAMQLELARRQQASAQESYRVVDIAYREGAARKVDQLGVHTALTLADATVVTVRYDHLMNQARLEYAMGIIAQNQE